MLKPSIIQRMAFLAFAFAAISLSVNAQEKLKFGKISLEEMKMTRYAKDPAAHAVILFDKGYFESNSNRFTRHLRLKILTNAGVGQSNFQLKTPSRGHIDGSTFNLVDGQIQESPLTKSNIFSEEIFEGYSVYKIFFPSVKPGSVVELKYSFVGLPYQWRFQEKIPIQYTELVIEPTRNIFYKKTMFGKYPIQNEGYKWYATDVPAFMEEPFMAHHSNYLTHFKFDIESIAIPGFYVDLSLNWASVAERLSEDKYFGTVMRNCAFLNEKAAELRASTAPVSAKIEEAFRYIRENIKWNGWPSAFASPDYLANFKKNHSGNSAEINLLLTALLKKADINAYPAVLSTRENGLLNPGSASMSSLNYVIAYIKTENLEMLLDATDPNLAPGILPLRCRTVTAFVIADKTGFWIDTSMGKASTRSQYISMQQNTEGKFIAEVSNTHQDYDFLDWIEGYNEQGDEQTYIKSVINRASDYEVQDCKITLDNGKMRATEKQVVALDNTNFIHDLGSEMVINPFILTDIVTPFKDVNRNYPVDLLYPKNRSVIISFRIPDNYRLRRLPESIVLKPECPGAKFSFMSTLNNNMLTIKCTLNIERQIFTETEYGALKTFFSEINRILSEPIQIDKV
jgi:hypothetical protein